MLTGKKEERFRSPPYAAVKVIWLFTSIKRFRNEIVNPSGCPLKVYHYFFISHSNWARQSVFSRNFDNDTGFHKLEQLLTISVTRVFEAVSHTLCYNTKCLEQGWREGAPGGPERAPKMGRRNVKKKNKRGKMEKEKR